MRLLIFVFFTLLVMQVFAETGHDVHAADEHAITIPSSVKYQALNVTILFVALFFVLRKSVVAQFKSRKADYLSAAEKAQAVKKQAEADFQDVQVKLNKLVTSKDESIARARVEANQYKAQLLEEANSLSNRLKVEAELAAKIEVEKAKNNLREELIKQSFVLATEDLKGSVNNEEQNKLQNEFIQSVRVVQQ